MSKTTTLQAKLKFDRKRYLELEAIAKKTGLPLDFVLSEYRKLVEYKRLDSLRTELKKLETPWTA